MTGSSRHKLTDVVSFRKTVARRMNTAKAEGKRRAQPVEEWVIVLSIGFSGGQSLQVESRHEEAGPLATTVEHAIAAAGD